MISVVTVNYKTMEYTLRMLESLFAYHDPNDVEVFVVENASGDSTEVLHQRFPLVKIIQSQKNLGFAGGCNLAIQQTKGDYIALINPDILFEDDALKQMEGAMRGDKGVGIGGVCLKNLDGSQQDCVWSFPRPIDQIFLLLKLNHVFPNAKPLRHWLMKDFDYSASANVDQVMGAFFVIRKETINQIGMLDDGFFMWYEEVDFCKRAVNAGWKVKYYATIHALHKKGASFDKIMTRKKQSMLRKSIRRYVRKHYGPVVGSIFILGEPIFFVMSLLASFLKPK